MSPARVLSCLAGLTLVACADVDPVDADLFTGAPADSAESSGRVPTAAPSAMAAGTRDLAVSIDGPSLTGTGDRQNYYFVVENHGTSRARNVVLTVDLPTQGSLKSAAGRCTVTGNQAVCSMGGVAAGASKQARIKWTMPSVETSVDFDVEATTTDTDVDASNDTAHLTVATTSGAGQALVGGESFFLVGCTAASPITWADCGSASGLYYEPLTLNADGSVTANTTADGAWSQLNDHTLDMQWEDPSSQTVVSVFAAEALDADCFEGTVVYPTYGFFGAWQMCRSGYPTP